MELEENVISSYLRLSKSYNINNFQNFVFIIIIIGLFYLFNLNYYIFHVAAEVFSCLIAGGIFMISFNTYNFTKNNYFMFLGIGHLFILALDIFHTINYGDLVLSRHFVYDIDTRLWVAARGLELMTYLISFVLLYKPQQKLNLYIVFLFFSIITSLLFLDILQYNIFIPTMRIEGIGITQNKIYFEYIAATGFLVCCFFLYFARNKIDKSLFIFLEISLICKVISEIFFTKYFSFTDFYNMMGHIIKVISYYSLYMGVIVNGLQRPFEMIKNNLDNADNEIKEKERQRMYMEEIIYQNEQCYDWIIDNSSNGIVIVRNKQLIYANSTALKMIGARTIHDIEGKELSEFIFDNYSKLEMLIKNSNSLNFNEITLLKLNKETLDVEYSINDITYRRQPAYLIFLRDMKLKKEIRNLKNDLLENEIELNKSNEYNKILTEFFSNISHDLKTPINVILSAVQLLILKEKNYNTDEFVEQLNRLLGIIKQNSYRLIRLISNLIDISKFETGFMKLDFKNLNIVNIVEDITLSVGDYIKSKGVNIIFDTDVEEKIIAVDADKIERIMLNLLSNAVKFTDIGDEILVYIEDNDDIVRISVKDTGVGIPNDKLKTIFDRFAQVENTLIRNKEGSGIGLSLVKSLIEMHGGNIRVNSKLGEGSEFIIELPVSLKEECYHELYDNSYNANNIDKVYIEFSDIYSID